jgi:alpha-tubulin suppressor-like RCC1 family protein
MLGDGTETSHAQPRPVSGLSGAVQIAADYTDSCATFADGTVSCWGSNNYGQLGDGTTKERDVPTPVLGYAVKQISLGQYHTCALMTDNTVRCWGLNTSGQVENGTTVDSLMPVPVPGVSNVVQIAAGGNLDCVLLADATVNCWGTNSGSDTCTGTNILHASATPVLGLAGVTQIAVGSTHACALLVDGTVGCWGLNTYGQLGRETACANSVQPDGQPGGQPPTEVGVIGDLSGVMQVSAGDGHTCALFKTGAVSCWGRNDFGQLGDGTTINHSAPTPVAGVTGATMLATGFADTCVVLSDQTLSCWGSVDPYGAGTSYLTPTPVTF